jgi:hypothetical protein
MKPKTKKQGCAQGNRRKKEKGNKRKGDKEKTRKPEKGRNGTNKQ